MTLQQRRLLDYLRAETAAGRLAPSFQQIADALGLRAKSGVHRIVTALEEQGRIRRRPGRARALEVVGGTLTAAHLAWCEAHLDEIDVRMAADARRAA